MILFEIFLVSSFFCALPSTSGYVHYGMKLDSDNMILDSAPDYDREELVEVLHSFRHRGPDADSSSSSSPSSVSGFTASPSFIESSSSPSSSEPNDHDNDYDDRDANDDFTSLSIKVHAFGEDVAVNLERVDSVLAASSTPVWLARGSPAGNVTFTRAAKNALGNAVKLYQDQQSESSILVITGSNSNPFFLGVISGFHIRYQPIGPRTNQRIHRRSTIDGYTGTHPHLVSKPSRKKREAQKSAVSAIKTQLKQSASLNASTIYPKLLVTTDYNIPFLSTTSEDFYDHLIYVLAFFNGVDLIFRQLSAPEVRLHIAGIIVSADRSAVPYIHNNKEATGAVNATAALGAMGRFYEGLSDKDFPAGSYDIIMTLTDTYICDEHEEEICTPVLAGVSSVEPLCKNNYPIVSMAAILQDNLAFSGLRMAAHELGHIMGAEHDGEEEEGTQDCSAQDGYLMSKYNESSIVSLNWSKCSLEAFKKSLQSSSAECLRNPPNWTEDDVPLPSILPGDINGLTCQCRALGYYRACAGPQNCQALTCTNNLFPFSVDCVKVGIPAAQGSICDFGYHCINGKCVEES